MRRPALRRGNAPHFIPSESPAPTAIKKRRSRVIWPLPRSCRETIVSCACRRRGGRPWRSCMMVRIVEEGAAADVEFLERLQTDFTVLGVKRQQPLAVPLSAKRRAGWLARERRSSRKCTASQGGGGGATKPRGRWLRGVLEGQAAVVSCQVVALQPTWPPPSSQPYVQPQVLPRRRENCVRRMWLQLGEKFFVLGP